jgi:hypothetical protein
MSDERPHMLRSRIDAVEVIVHDTQTPGDAEWSAWVSEYRTTGHELRALLVYSLGGGPNGKQRSELTALFPELQKVPLAYIVTSSVVMRGIVTAVSWFLPPSLRAKTYGIDDLERALTDIGLATQLRADITRTIQAHLKTLGQTTATRRAS